MKVKSILIAVLVLCSKLPVSAEIFYNLKIYPVKDRIEIRSGEPGTIKIKIKIPDKLYIYGNPKGPGIGRPTTIDIKYPDNFSFAAAKFAAPEKYIAKGDTNFVWIYRNETIIELPFNTKKESRPGEYRISILVKTLLCSDRSCTPYDHTIDYPIRIVPNLPDATGNEKNNKSFSYIAKDPAFSSPGKNQSNSLLTGKNEKDNKNASQDISSIKPKFLSAISVSNIVQAVFYGIIAGFILNFMPCVLPVISLKILDIIKYAGKDRKETGKMGIIFTLGIMTTFVALACLAAFLGYSWGSLFRSNIFLIAMIAVVFALSLSMFEIFAINIPGLAGTSHGISNKYANTYSKGLLATLLATPCSGPFLGGTLAWAFIQPPAVIFIIFISIGLGMSAPYIILTANPGLMKFIPKPGSWMITFENIMGFLLLGTVVYFVSILKTDLIVPTLWFLVFIGIAFWQYGRFGSLNKPKKHRLLSRITALLIIISGYFISYDFIYSNEELSEIQKNTFSILRLFENRDAGKISIIDFTADWCPNCKLVEKTSLYTEKVKDAIKQNNIDLLIADMTRENSEAEALLKQLGSRSIPFLAVFPSGKSFFEPVCLRDIYSEKDVLKAIEMSMESGR